MRKLLTFLIAALMSVGMFAATEVTITQNDFPSSGESFTKDGVTVSAGMIDGMGGNLMDGGSFSTTLGNFTQIEVNAEDVSIYGPGWTGNFVKKTWTGNASSVSFSGEIMGNSHGVTLKFTIAEPTPTYTVALEDGTVNADKVTLSANESEAGQTVTVTPVDGYEITSLTVSYLTNNYSVRVKEEFYGDIEDVDPQVVTLPREFTVYPQTGDDGSYKYNDISGGDDKVEHVSGTDNTLTFRVTGAFDGIASIEYEYYTQECNWDEELGEDFCWDQTSIQDIQVACSQIGGNAAVSENAGVYSFTMPAGNVTITAMVEAIAAPDFAGEGTQANPYRITSAADWNIFATRVSEGTTYSGVYFQLTNDIAISTMVGTDMDHAFNGTFDGDGHTITATLNSSAAYCAPFAFTYGATIKNLHTTGTINTSNSNAGGVVGRNGTASLTLTNVSCDMTINSTMSGNASHGGLMGYAINATVSGCAFTGRLLGESSSRFGGMLGWKSNTDNSSVNFTDCLFAPTQVTMSASNSKTFAVIGGAGTTVNLTNCYYTQAFDTDQGKQMRAITAGDGVTVANAGTATVYSISGITSYGTGIKYNNVLYGGNGDNLSLAISGSTGYKPSAGTLTGADPYTLTMADANTIIYPAATCTAPTAINPTYTGVAQALVNAGTVTGGTMYYSLDNSAWDAAIPTGTVAGDYTVYYKVIGDATHADYTPSPNTVAATIAKAPLTITADEKWIDYGDELMYMVATYTGFVNGEDAGVVSPAVHFSSDYTQGDNAGTYTITPYGAGAANYEISYQTGVLHVNKVASTITTTPTAIDGLVANGSAQTLINAGEATGGEMQYSLNNTSWSTDLPTATDANTYTVYYKVVGDVNHNSIPAASLSVTIAPASASMVITANEDPNHAGVYYSTFYDSSVKYALPAGVEAYIATISGNDLLMNKIAVAGQTIPANNAVILKSTVNPFTLTVSDATPVTFSDANSLQGTDVAIATPANCYVLSGKSGVGFYQYTGANLNPHKAYVIFSGSFAPQRMRFIFQEEQNTTTVDNAEAENTQTIKVVENGALYIIKDGVRYNAQGQIVEL